MYKYHLRVSTAVKRYHDHSNSYKGKDLVGAGLQFRGSVHYCMVRSKAAWADMMLEKELRVLDPDLQAAGD